MSNTNVLELDSPPPQSRIHALDVVRGVAILGTLWTNIWLFTNPNGLYGALTITSQQSFGERLLTALSQGKFLALLSLIFGVGLALQYNSARRRDHPWPGSYRRRMVLLLIDGALNYLLIAEFDVLMGYACTGFIVSYLILTTPKTQRRTMITLSAVHISCIALLAWATHAYQGDQTYVSTPYAHGSFTDLIAFRLDNLGIFRSEMILIAPLTVVMFLAGIHLYSAGAFEKRGQVLRKRLLIIGVGALVLDLTCGISGITGLVLIERYILAPVSCLALLVVIVEVCHRCGTDNLIARLLRSVGRTALSCYLLQNLLGGMIFYGWGFGLVNNIQQWRTTATMLGYVVIATAVVLFAHLWLKRFSTGPVEWAWKQMMR